MIGITGGNGVLGRLISNSLKRKGINFTSYSGDIRVLEDLKLWLKTNRVDIVLHLAAKVAIDNVKNSPLDAMDVNVNGMIQLLKAIELSDQEIYLFYASTSHVYKSSNIPIDENAEISPISFYGKTKRLAEEAIINYCNEAVNSKIDYCIGRIFSFYHHSQKPPFLYPTLIDRFANEDLSKPFKIRGGNSVRDFLNAEEVATIIQDIANFKLKGIYNIGSGKGQRIVDFVESIAPVSLNYVVDGNEKFDYLVADVTKLNNAFL